MLIAFREAVNYKITEKCVDSNVRYIVLNVLLDSVPFILVNYYAPNYETDQLKLLEELRHIFDQLDTAENTTLIWGGDFNIIFDTYLDADGGTPKLYVKSVSKLLSLMSENDLCDIYRLRNPDIRQFTWRRKTSFKQRRLDFFLISDSFQENVATIDITPTPASDHSCLLMKIHPVRDGTQGRGYWKLNNSLVEDKYFVNLLKNEISRFSREIPDPSDPIVKWEYIKYKCREFSRQYSIEKLKERKSRRLFLENKLAEFEVKISTQSNDDILEEYNKCKSELDGLYDYITAGVILRSKCNLYEHGEKSSRYFLTL